MKHFPHVSSDKEVKVSQLQDESVLDAAETSVSVRRLRSE